jgi:hypothetical protein
VTLAIAALLLPALGFAATTTWDGSTSTSWTDGTNWSAGVPGAGDTAVIPSTVNDPVITTNVTVNTVTISSGGVLNVNSPGSLTTTNFNLNSGTLGGSGNVTISGALNVTGGTMDTGGTTTLGASGTGTFDTSYMALNRPFVNNGDITMSASAYFYMNTGGSFVNASGASIDLQQNTYAFYGIVNTVTVTNNGTFLRSTSSGTATIYNIVFTNTSPGTVQAQTGKIDFSTAGSSANTGTFTISAGASIDFGGSATRTNQRSDHRFRHRQLHQRHDVVYRNLHGHEYVGPPAATVNFNEGSTVTFVNLSLGGSGTLAGSANMNITTLFDMNSGTLAGGGTTTLANGATGTFDSSYLTLTRPFVNNGDITLTSNAYFYMNTGASFVNSSTGTVDIQHNTYAFYGQVNTLTVVNTGTILRSTSSGTATIYNLVFTNTSPGSVQVQSGTLDLNTTGSSTNTGAFTISGGATIDFGGSGTRTISGAVTGGGSVNFSAGTTTLTGTYSISNTTIPAAPPSTSTMGSTQKLRKPDVEQRTLAGTANVNITTLLDMNSGTMTGGGTTTLANGADRDVRQLVSHVDAAFRPTMGRSPCRRTPTST